MNGCYLITAIGGDIGDSVVHCLRKEYPKEKLIGCDITCYVPAYDEVGSFFLAPPYTEEAKYMSFLLEQCEKYKITYILPMTEGEIKVFDKHRDDFEKAGIKVMIQSSEILKATFRKYHTAKTIKAMGLNSPKTWKVEEIGKEISYPVIVKPDQGCGSRNVKVVHNFEEYQDAVSRIPDAVIQEYIGIVEEEYTVGVFSNGKTIQSIAFKRTLDLNGMSKMVELVEDEKITQIAFTVAKNFRLKGSINLQMRKQDGEYYIFEINPRISSTVGFRYRLGFKDVRWWLDLLAGNGENIFYVPERLPVVGMRTYSEKIFRNVFPISGNGR